jgi:hypothetical protein
MHASGFNLLRSTYNRASIEMTHSEPELDEGDPRFGLFADKINRFQGKIALWTYIPSCSKQMKTILEVIWPFIGRIKYFIWIYIFIGRPDWCRNEHIDSHCRWNFTDKKTYVRSFIPFFDLAGFAVSVYGSLVFMTLVRLLRYKMALDNPREKKVLITLMIVTTLILSLESYQAVAGKNISGRRFLLIIYLSIFSDTVRTNILRVLGIAVKGFEVLIVYFLLYIGGGMLNRILFYDNPLNSIQTDAWIYFDYDFSTTARSIFTQFIGDPGVGNPAVFANALALGKGNGLMLFLQTW